MRKTDNREVAQEVLAHLDDDEMQYLQHVAMDESRKSKSRLSLEDVIRGLVDATMAVHVSATGVRTKDELVQRVLETCRLNVDRRKYPRLKKHLLVQFRLMDTLTDFDHSRTLDVGKGGFRMELRDKKRLPPVGAYLEIQIRDENELLEPIHATGRVVWVREKSEGSGFEVGVKLTHLEKEHEKRFLECLWSGNSD